MISFHQVGEFDWTQRKLYFQHIPTNPLWAHVGFFLPTQGNPRLRLRITASQFPLPIFTNNSNISTLFNCHFYCQYLVVSYLTFSFTYILLYSNSKIWKIFTEQQLLFQIYWNTKYYLSKNTHRNQFAYNRILHKWIHDEKIISALRKIPGPMHKQTITIKLWTRK